MELRNSASSNSLFHFLLLFLISSSLPSLTLSATVRCNPHDKYALLAFKKSLNNPSDLASWIPNTDCCNWTYIECDPNTNRVTQVSINRASISGEIPAAIGDLPYLDTLVLNNMNLTGSIPYSITKLQHLRRLTISETTLSTRIPQFLGQVKSLQYLILSVNQLYGPIPASLANLNKLVSLQLQGNKLSGKIPKSLGKLNLDSIILLNNKFVGDASMFLRADAATTWINLSRNRLDFDLSKVGFPLNLTFLDLSHNRIRGSIPKQITELDSILVMDFSNNRLCGKIPFGGKMQDQGEYPFLHNRCLCGPPLPNSCK
ncbi:PREDICTED: polygalacturonase inhibitor-like [Nelumbo nucifera]|uniref:Polygalacturonase inhibitor-like n=2 Tax=Nelumbo nucifera TaxID=4432 RepID=A0A1U8AE43_NELNU|nr:PREDICTED: polygalacturonase inhibitor-like [Nelumbo nucifera]DAD29910.1 TPA_asm: hypothetical protein HUJ06_031378 [Nelumbo nucifera]